jgi:latrophilin 3
VFLLGLTWTFGLLYLSESTVAMAYVFTILNSFQGFFIFFLHCFQDEQVRKDVYKALHRHGCLPTSCLSGAGGSSSSASASGTSPSAGGKDNQTIFYGSSGATSAGATLTAGDALTTATVSFLTNLI